MPRIELLVIQPTTFCNIDCRYCYLPERNSKAVVAPATLVNLFSQIFASGWPQDCLSVVWHAGEPMVLPIEFYRDALRMIDRAKPAELTVTHSFQTNGTLIDDAWCEFLVAERVRIGVSIDGPRHLHDINRRTRSGQGTFDRTVAGIRRLRRHGVPFHVICVVGARTLEAVDELADFFIAEGIFQIATSIVYRDVISRSWGWMLVSGISDLLLAAIVILGLPISAGWALGLIVGINLITSGLAVTMTALAGRKMIGRLENGTR